MTQQNTASDRDGEQPFDPETIPDVVRILRNEILGVGYQNKFSYEGVLILEVETLQRNHANTKTCVIQPLRFLVVGQNTETAELITYRVKGRAHYVHGLDLTARSKSIDNKHMSWSTGLQLKWKSDNGKISSTPSAVQTYRLAYLKSIGEIFSGSHTDEKWENIDWDGIRSIIDEHKSSRDAAQSMAASIPSKNGATASRTEEKKNSARLKLKLSIPKTIRKFNAYTPAQPSATFHVDQYSNLTSAERTEAQHTFSQIEIGLQAIDQRIIERLVAFINKAYPWCPLPEQVIHSYVQDRDRETVWRLQHWPAFQRWWAVARQRPAHAKPTII